MRGNGLKWTYYDQDVLAGWVAEMDFGLAPAVAEALHQAVDDSLTGYPYPDAEQAVADAATEFWQDRFQWAVDPEHVFPAPDVIEGLRRAIIHLTEAGSPVILHSPVYFPFYGMVQRAGREVVEVTSDRDTDGRYTLNLEGIDRALADGAGSVVLCNPWNPTGRVFSNDELRALLAVASRHDARVLADEIHGAITFGDSIHLPLATLDPERTVTVTSASKAWNLPGLKCAQVVLTNERDRVKWASFFTPEKVGVGTFGLLANEAAYRGGVDWFDGILDQLSDNRELFSRLVADRLPDAVYRPPEGTYLGWLDMTASGLEDPASFFLDEARVALTAGAPFGGRSAQCVRFNFATQTENITEMVDRMAAALDRR